MKKVISLFLIIIYIFNIIACGKKENSENKIYNKNYEKNLIEESTVSQQVENIRYMEKLDSPERIDLNDYSSDKDKAYTEDNNKKITLTLDGETITLTFKELGERLNEMLSNKQYKDYKVNEKVIYNYIHTTNKQSTGIFLEDEVEEIRKNEQYYRDIKRNVGNQSYQRDVVALKYKNRANDEYYIGQFSTKQKNKKVELEWEETNLENEETLNLSAIKQRNFSGITDFYYFNTLNDYKAKGKMTLKQWRDEVLITRNTGIATLRNVEAKPKKEVTEKGKTVEKSLIVRPLDFEFEYTLAKKDDIITFEATNITKILEDYYKFFKEYNIDKCSYIMTVEEFEPEDTNDINNLFGTSPINEIQNDEKEQKDEEINISTNSNITTSESNNISNS